MIKTDNKKLLDKKGLNKMSKQQFTVRFTGRKIGQLVDRRFEVKKFFSSFDQMLDFVGENYTNIKHFRQVLAN